MSESGQVSETTAMSPQSGRDGTPGTDDGVPPASESQHIPARGPRDYDDETQDSQRETQASASGVDTDSDSDAAHR